MNNGSNHSFDEQATSNENNHLPEQYDECPQQHQHQQRDPFLEELLNSNSSGTTRSMDYTRSTSNDGNSEWLEEESIDCEYSEDRVNHTYEN